MGTRFFNQFLTSVGSWGVVRYLNKIYKLILYGYGLHIVSKARVNVQEAFSGNMLIYSNALGSLDRTRRLCIYVNL